MHMVNQSLEKGVPQDHTASECQNQVQNQDNWLWFSQSFNRNSLSADYPLGVGSELGAGCAMF